MPRDEKSALIPRCFFSLLLLFHGKPMYVGKKRVEKEKKEMGGDLAGWRLKSRVPRSHTTKF